MARKLIDRQPFVGDCSELVAGDARAANILSVTPATVATCRRRATTANG